MTEKEKTKDTGQPGGWNGVGPFLHAVLSLTVLAAIIGGIYWVLDHGGPEGPTVMMEISWFNTADDRVPGLSNETTLSIQPSLVLYQGDDGIASTPDGEMVITPILKPPKEAGTFIVQPLSGRSSITDGKGSAVTFGIWGDNMKQEYLDAVALTVSINRDGSYETSEYTFAPTRKPLTTWRGHDTFFWLKVGAGLLILATLLVFTGDLTRRKMRAVLPHVSHDLPLHRRALGHSPAAALSAGAGQGHAGLAHRAGPGQYRRCRRPGQ